MAKRRVWAAVVAVVALAGATPASATDDAAVSRLAGTDRIGTANAISADVWAADAATVVVLARSDNYPDALSGGPLAVAKSGPLLLTTSSSLTAATLTEINRVLAPGATVYLLGGTGALSPTVEQQLDSAGYNTVRYGGVNRYETAVIVNRDGLGNPATFFVADGLSFPDPLIAASAAPAVDGGVLLTAGSAMPAETNAYIAAHAGATRYAVGSAARTADPGATALVGTDQYDTARVVAERFFATPGIVALASGTSFPDALAGGAHIGRLGGPLLLTAADNLPGPADRYLRSKAATLLEGFIYGGTAPVSANVASQYAESLRDARTFGDGTHRVGTDIEAGTYRTRADASGCYWERLSGFSGGIDDIVANDFTNYHSVVTIDPSDAGFSTERCGTWTSDLTTITASPTAPFGSGTWIVHVDIAAGTWRAPGGDGCYWERLSGFSGEGDDIEANGFGDTNPTVEISSSDRGFSTNDCGNWTKLD